MSTVSIAGGQHIFYIREGRGEPVVFLHAFPLWGEMWSKQLKALGEKWSGIATDFRGFGYSQSHPGAYTIDALAEEVKKTLDALEVKQKAVIVGLSMGGYVALSFAVQWPDRVRALVLADTKATADSDEAKKSREEMIKLAHDEKKGGMEKVATALLPKLLSEGTREEHPDLLHQVHDWIIRADPESFEKAQRAMAERPDRTAALPGIKAPTLVMVGMADEVTPVSDAQAISGAIPGAQFELFMGAGHLSNLEKPGNFNKALVDFIEALPPLA